MALAGPGVSLNMNALAQVTEETHSQAIVK